MSPTVTQYYNTNLCVCAHPVTKRYVVNKVLTAHLCPAVYTSDNVQCTHLTWSSARQTLSVNTAQTYDLKRLCKVQVKSGMALFGFEGDSVEMQQKRIALALLYKRQHKSIRNNNVFQDQDYNPVYYTTSFQCFTLILEENGKRGLFIEQAYILESEVN